MKCFAFLLAAATVLFAGGRIAAQDIVVDSNSALYEGVEINYVFTAPTGYRLDIDRANLDGYSMAFLPAREEYETATVMIAVTIYSLSEQKHVDEAFEAVLTEDTTSIREHYGDGLIVREVDSMLDGSGVPVRTFFLEDTTRFIPDVMVSYFDGGAEMVISQLTITDAFPRFLAEGVYTEYLRGFKTLVRARLFEPEEAKK